MAAKLTVFPITFFNRKHLLSFFIFTIAAVYITYPLIFHLTSFTTGFGDELLIAWIMNWNIHAIFSNPLHIFNANIYYPYHNSLAFSDTHFTSSIIVLPAVSFFHEPIVANNVTLITSLILLGFSMYLLVHYLTNNFFASLLSGVMVIFSPAVLDKSVHLQVLAIEWVPLSMLFFLKFFESKKNKDFVLFCLFFLFQFYNSFMPAYFILFFAVVFLLYIFITNKKKLALFKTKQVLIVSTITAVLMIPIIIPYLEVSKEFNYARDIRDSIHFALQPEDLLYPNDSTNLKPFLLSLFDWNSYPKSAEVKPGYLGAVFSILVILSIVHAIKYRKKLNGYFIPFLMTGILGLLLSFGPALHFMRQTIHHPFPILLPYGLFYYILPGFNGFRNSSRFEMLFILCIAVVIGFLIHELFSKQKAVAQYIIYSLLLLGILVEYNFPMHFQTIIQTKNFPPEYSWLRTTPKNSSIIELPAYTWYMQPYSEEEMLRQYYSTENFRNMVNGASGYSPKPWEDMIVNIMDTFPSQKSLRILQSVGVNYIIVHADEYNTLEKNNFTVQGKKVENGKTIIQKLSLDPNVRLVKHFSSTYIYKLSYAKNS